MRCPNCGKEVLKTDKFCKWCGAVLKENNSNYKNEQTVNKVEPDNSVNTIKKEKNFFIKLMAGDFGLAKTYWVYGFLANMVFSIIIKALVAAHSIALVWIVWIISLIWSIMVLIGVWNAAGKYTGPKIWAILARVAVILGVLSILAPIILPALLGR